jgi:hypothetical protein
MASHSISVHPSKPLEVVNADLVVEVRSDGGKLGEMWISKGSVDWRPKGYQYATRSLSWEQFAALMSEPDGD